MMDRHLFGMAGYFLDTSFTHSLSKYFFGYPTHKNIFCQIPFGGYFWCDNISLKIEGALIDIYGESRIRGKLEKNSLKFDKFYKSRDTKISYEFRKKKSLWLGKYNDIVCSDGRTIIGQPSQLSISPIQDLTNEQISSVNIEM